MNLWKKCAAVLWISLLVLVCCGCQDSERFTLDPQKLYCLPELPAKYTELNRQLGEVLSHGGEYAAPVSGSNLQPVQMWDLDGDGKEEALAFFRCSADEKPLKIYIYHMEDGVYRESACIEGSGTAIHSIAYSDMDGDGLTELAVGWRVSPDLLALSIYSLRPEGPQEIVCSNYVRYSILDLDDNDCKELVVLRTDKEGSGVADYYAWQDGVISQQSSVRISMTMAQLSQQGRVRGGMLQDGVPALFLTGVETGTEETARAVYDILTVKNGEFLNVVLSDTTGVSSEIAPFCGLYPTDINGDNVTDVPWPAGEEAEESGGPNHRFIEWRSYDAKGRSHSELSTYHDVEDGWYFRIPEGWKDKVHAQRSVQGEEISVTFYICGEDKTCPFLRITAISGNNRMARAVRGKRFNLSRTPDTIYVAEILDANDTWSYGMNQDQVRAAFSLIRPEWSAEDN